MSRTLPVILGLALLASTPLVAQTKRYIPSNTPGTGLCENLPFTSGAMRFHYLLTGPQVHPVLGAPVKITDIAFAPCATATFTATQCQIRMSNVPTGLRTCFKGNLKAPVIVYEGPLTWNAVKDTWSPIQLQFPFFTRIGWENVSVEIRYRGGNLTLPVHSDGTLSRVYNNIDPNPYNATCSQVSPESFGPKTRLTFDSSGSMTLWSPDHSHLGLIEKIEIFNATPGDTFQIAAAMSQSPLQVGPVRINLTWDSTAYVSVFVGPPLFNGYRGTIDHLGRGTGYFFTPKDPRLLGLYVYHAAVTLNWSRITGCTNTVGLVVWP